MWFLISTYSFILQLFFLNICNLVKFWWWSITEFRVITSFLSWKHWKLISGFSAQRFFLAVYKLPVVGQIWACFEIQFPLQISTYSLQLTQNATFPLLRMVTILYLHSGFFLLTFWECSDNIVSCFYLKYVFHIETWLL